MSAPETLGMRVPKRTSLPWPFAVGGLLVGLHLAVALLSLVWTPYGIGDMAGGRLEGPSLLHWAGTDRLGRDLMTQIMIGSRIALIVGCGAVVLGALIGVALGVFAAFATRTLDDVLAAALDILIAFPTLLLAMLIVASSDGASLGTAILAIGIAGSAIVARLTRILAKRILSMDYITAARISGTSWPAIVRIHILPNIWPTLIVNFALQFGLAVIAEASLSYLGLGAPPPNASWAGCCRRRRRLSTQLPSAPSCPALPWSRWSSASISLPTACAKLPIQHAGGAGEHLAVRRKS